jgi:Leucine-rich repeat (LRR) protein
MNDLRLLYEYDKDRKIINLEYKQITNLEPLIPILSKFENLESLSLNGNRLKSLPSMETFLNLAEIDISSNLFNDIKFAIKGLKSLPALRHLIYTFKNDDEEEELKN